MSTDLHALFADAYRDAPPSTLDADLVVRRGRRLRARRQAVSGTGALLGAGVVVAGSVALVGGPGHGAPGTLGAVAGAGSTSAPVPALMDPGFAGASPTGDLAVSPTPSASGATPVDSPTGLVDPSSTPTPWRSGDPTPVPSASPSSIAGGLTIEPRPAGIDAISLPDPAPGFPVRRWADHVAPTMLGGPSGTYYVAQFGLAKTPYATVPGSPGSHVWTGPEITILVGDFPLPSHTATSVEGNPIVARPSVAGVTGLVTTGMEKKTPLRMLYATTGTWTIQILGTDSVTTAELVALANAITGIR